MAFQDIGLRLVIMGTGEFRRGMTDARSQVAGLSREINMLSTSTGSVGTRLSTLGSTFMRTGQLLTTHLTVPIALLGGSLLAAGIQFEDAFAGVSKTVDGVSDDFGNLTKDGEQLKEQFRDLALRIPLSVNEFARIGELGGQLGITKGELKDFVETVALLGVTTEMTSEDAATFFARLGNIMGVASDDMAEFTKQAGSTVVDLGNKFAATEPEIATLSLRLAGAGQAAGLSTQQILALATAMASMGIQAEMGGSAVSRILLETKRAVDDFNATGGQATDQLKLFARAAGLTVQEFVAMQKNDPKEVFMRLVGGFNRMSKAGEISNDVLATMNLDTIRLQDVLNRMGPNMALVAQAMDVANVEWAEGNALQIEAQKRFNTTKSQLILLKNAFVDLGIEIFYLYRTPINALIKGLRALITGWTELDDGVLKTAVSVGVFVAALGPIVSILGVILSFLGITVTSLGFFGAKLLFVSGIVGVLGTIWAGNFGMIQDRAAYLVNQLKYVTHWLGEAYKYGKTRFEGNIFKGIASVFKAMTYVFKDNKKTFFSSVLAPFRLGAKDTEALGMKIRDKLAPSLISLYHGFSQLGFAFNEFKRIVSESGLKAALEWLFKPQEIAGLKGTAIAPLERVLRAFGLSAPIMRFKQILESLATETWPKLKTFGKAVAGLVTDVASYIASDILPAIGKAIEWFATEFVPAILPVLTNVVNTIKNLFDNAKPVIMWFFETGIPSLEKVLIGDGGDGGVVGAFDSFVGIVDQLSPIIGPLIPLLLLAWGAFTILSPVVTGVKIAIAALNTVGLLLNGWLGLLLLPLGIAIGLVYLYTTNTWGLKDAIDSILPRIRIYRDVWKNIKTIFEWFKENGIQTFFTEFIVPKALEYVYNMLVEASELAYNLGLISKPLLSIGAMQSLAGIGGPPPSTYRAPLTATQTPVPGGGGGGTYPPPPTFLYGDQSLLDWPGRAMGGWLRGPTLVGERGAELFWPGREGYVLNNKLTRFLSMLTMGYGGGFGNTTTSNFSPTINAVPMRNERAMGDELMRVYRMAQMGASI